MLTLCLRGLERDGMVRRTVFPVVPPRVEYELTPLGRSLCEPVIALGSWALDHIAEIDAARAAFDRREGPGRGAPGQHGSTHVWLPPTNARSDRNKLACRSCGACPATVESGIERVWNELRRCSSMG